MYRFDAEIWRWQAREDGWYFVTLPEDVSDDIDARVQGRAGGFGSVRVAVRLGPSGWATSVFPDTQRGAFVLPLKKAVRTAAAVGEGDVVAIELDLQNPD